MSSSLILGPFDLLDPTSPVFLAPGFDRGAPAPTVSEVQSTILDGAAVTGRAAGNRHITLPILVRGTDRLTVAGLTNQVLQAVDAASWELTFTPDGGLPIVFDCYRGTSAITSDLLQDSQCWQALSVQCEALPYGRSLDLQTVTLAGTSVQIEGFNASTIPVTTTAVSGTVTATSRSTSVKFEGASSLKVDYSPGPTSVQLVNSGTVSIPVTFPLAVVSVRVQTLFAMAMTATGDWVLTLTTDMGTFTATESSGMLPGSAAWSVVSFDMSDVPIGATITGWSLQTAVLTVTRGSGGTLRSFSYTGGVQTFTVPAGVTSVRVTLVGPGGGGPYPYGGTGGLMTGVLAVSPGDVLNVRVGGAGGAFSSSTSAGGAGGYNGGGAGGHGISAGRGGYGGGGATDIRVNSNSVSAIVAVAGGAGGAGRGATNRGGDGGGYAGGYGRPTSGAYTGGHAGGQTTGGAAGSSANGDATAGAAHVGGAGGSGSNTGSWGGGGGGAGYNGGGGGGGSFLGNDSGGGGGGCAYAASSVTDPQFYTFGGANPTENGSATIIYDTSETLYFDDLRAYPAQAAGVTDNFGGVYLLSDVIGTARTPISVAVAKATGGTFSAWAVHTPPVDLLTAQPLIPLGGSASGVSYTTDPSVQYGGTYAVWVAAAAYSGSGARTVTATFSQSAPSGGPTAAVSASITPVSTSPLVYLGVVTLPLTAYPAESSVATTVTVTSTFGADTFNDVLLLDTRGQSVIVDGTAPAQLAGWADAPDPTRALGGVWAGTDRTTATSVASSLLAAGVLIQNPGDSQIMLYGPAGALSATVSYYPRWLQEATQ